MQIQASILHGPKDIRIVRSKPPLAAIADTSQETRTIGPPRPDEVQVAIRCTGLCGSDVHYYKHFRNGNIQVREPLTLGHESAGVVVAAGPGVHDLKEGDAVALEVGVPCGACEQCAAGRYNLCPAMEFRSSAKRFPHAQGTLQQRVNHPARFCHRIPAGLSFAEGALAEPISVALHALRRAGFAAGRRVLVFGAGPVGLCVAGLARIKGAGRVVIADIDGQRLDFATGNGIADSSHTMSTAGSGNIDEQLKAASEMPARLKEVSLPSEYDIVFECTGSPACLQAAIFVSVSAQNSPN
jgi:L-iditol 2-dehydrogenase